MLLNGKGDKMEFQLGELAVRGFPIEDLKKQADISPAARASHDAHGFSERIREHRVGF
jgi:hypothetical protein